VQVDGAYDDDDHHDDDDDVNDVICMKVTWNKRLSFRKPRNDIVLISQFLFYSVRLMNKKHHHHHHHHHCHHLLICSKQFYFKTQLLVITMQSPEYLNVRNSLKTAFLLFAR